MWLKRVSVTTPCCVDDDSCTLFDGCMCCDDGDGCTYRDDGDGCTCRDNGDGCTCDDGDGCTCCDDGDGCTCRDDGVGCTYRDDGDGCTCRDNGNGCTCEDGDGCTRDDGDGCTRDDGDNCTSCVTSPTWFLGVDLVTKFVVSSICFICGCNGTCASALVTVVNCEGGCGCGCGSGRGCMGVTVEWDPTSCFIPLLITLNLAVSGSWLETSSLRASSDLPCLSNGISTK